MPPPLELRKTAVGVGPHLSHRQAVVGAGTGHFRKRQSPGTTWAVPGVPLVMDTITPTEAEMFSPTASQVVALGQATPPRSWVPDTTWGVPGIPSVMGTTTPEPERVSPTAKQVVALGQATP